MIKLISNYPYDNKYDYIKTFKTATEQNNYFESFSYTSFNDNNYIKENEKSFKVSLSYDYMVSKGMNYIIFNNGYKDIYAFIIEKQYVSEEVTRIIFEVDVIQTYLFDFNIRRSYIERKKCSINEISDFDEGFNIGEHEITQVMTTLPKNYSYYAMFSGIRNQELVFQEGKLIDVIEAPFAMNRPLTTIDGIQYPLHFMELQESYLEPTFVKMDTSGITGGSDGGSWEDGILSSKGFRFIKGMEGFAPRPYQDSGGYWTICYGVTKHGEPSVYDDLVSKAPVSEEEGAKISYKLKNEKYGSKIVNTCKEIGVTKQHQFDALCSLAYNSGVGSVTGDNSLMNAIRKNINDEATIRPLWESFKTSSNGIQLNGLKALRREQCNMFFGKDFEIRPIGKITTSGTISGTVTENGGNGWLP